MTRIIVFDLDGTLALDTHRSHHLMGENKNWKLYFDLCESDPPNAPIVQMYDNLIGAPEARVEIWTGRVDSHEVPTIRWIEDHLIYPPDRLRMRSADDRTDDDQMKRAWLNEAREVGDEVILAFEDRQRVVDMWREEGVVCAQVAEGDF